MKEHFEKFLGLGNATDNENDLLAYGYDGSDLRGKARVVLFPSQDEQLRLVLSYANRANIDVVVRGNGSNQNGMTIPNQSIVVCMQGFDRVHAINVRERWVQTDCGVTLAELNDALKQHGWHFPLDTSTRRLNTVGGLLATNRPGRYSLRYGVPGDRVVELELIDGSGKSFTVKKDFTDYLGDEGTTFILIRAKLRIERITDRSADFLYYESPAALAQALPELIAERPIAIEYLDAAAATYAGINTRHTLLVEWDGDRGALKYEQYVSALHRRDGARRHLGMKGYTLLEDGRVPLDQYESAIRWCESHGLPAIGHAGVGVIHPLFRRDQEKERGAWYDWLAEHGDVGGQHGFGLRKKRYVPRELQQKIRRLKERHDYNNVLGRGKLYDYI